MARRADVAPWIEYERENAASVVTGTGEHVGVA